MRSRPFAAVLLVAVALGTAGCADDEPLATPVRPSLAPTALEAPPSPSPSPEPSPSPSPTPLSPFEDDPAVVALRAYLAVSSTAINTQNLDLPEFAALATAARASRHRDLFTEDLGTYYPGPPPAAVRGVQVVSPTSRVVSICLLDMGYALDKQGGTPTAARNVAGALVEMALEEQQWKVDRFLRDPDGTCEGVELPGDNG